MDGGAGTVELKRREAAPLVREGPLERVHRMKKMSL
jgi:hypothetical protein